jgi:hypothetical protein
LLRSRQGCQQGLVSSRIGWFESSKNWSFFAFF